MPEPEIAPVQPSPPERRRGGCLTAFLVVMMIVNPLTALVYFLGASFIKRGLPDAPAWSMPVLGAFCILNTACAVALWKWKKWGLYGFVFSAVVALIVNIVIGLPLAQVVAGPIGVVVLYVLVRPSWTQME